MYGNWVKHKTGGMKMYIEFLEGSPLWYWYNYGGVVAGMAVTVILAAMVTQQLECRRLISLDRDRGILDIGAAARVGPPGILHGNKQSRISRLPEYRWNGCCPDCQFCVSDS